MEGSHGELGTRFTYGLSSYDTDCFSYIYVSSCCEVPAVALGAYTCLALTGHDRSDADCFNSCVLNSLSLGIADLFACCNYDFAGLRIDNVDESSTSDYPEL